MATLAAISSTIIKKTYPLHNYKTSSFSTINCTLSCMNWTNDHTRYLALGGEKIYQHERYNVPLEVPERPNNVPDFDPIPPEKPEEPPSQSPPKPEAPVPPLSPPMQPEVVPPHGPEIIPDIPRTV